MEAGIGTGRGCGERETGGDPGERDRPKGPEGNLEEVLVGVTKVWVRRSRSGVTRWGCGDAGGAAVRARRSRPTCGDGARAGAAWAAGCCWYSSC